MRLYHGSALPEARPDWFVVACIALDFIAAAVAIALLLAL